MFQSAGHSVSAKIGVFKVGSFLRRSVFKAGRTVMRTRVFPKGAEVSCNCLSAVSVHSPSVFMRFVSIQTPLSLSLCANRITASAMGTGGLRYTSQPPAEAPRWLERFMIWPRRSLMPRYGPCGVVCSHVVFCLPRGHDCHDSFL